MRILPPPLPPHPRSSHHITCAAASFSTADVPSNFPTFEELQAARFPPTSVAVPTYTRPLDVQLPAGVSISDYWPVAFNFNPTPVAVFVAGSLDTMEYCNPAFAMLFGDKTARLHEGDRTMLARLAQDLSSGRRAFFTHAFTFVNDAGTVLLAEGNATSCLTASGMFAVIEVAPVLSRRKGVLSTLAPVSEINFFGSYFHNSPQPSALLMPSGYVLAVNRAFLKEVNLRESQEAVCTHIGSFFPAAYTMTKTMWEHWFQSDRPGYQVQLNVCVSCVAFRRGAADHHDHIRAYLLTVNSTSNHSVDDSRVSQPVDKKLKVDLN